MRLVAYRKPEALYIVCRRCGVEAPDYVTARPWRCRDCKDLECERGHLWPDPPVLDVRGHRRCLVCNQLRRLM